MILQGGEGVGWGGRCPCDSLSVSQTSGVTPGDAPVMFLWIFSTVIAVGCRVTLLYYTHTHPDSLPATLLLLLLLLRSLLSVSVSQSLTHKNEREIGPEWLLATDGERV